MLQLANRPLGSGTFLQALLVPVVGGFAALFAGGALAGALARALRR
jgi:hypothetical protein